MDQQLHDSSSFERAFAVAQQRHKETIDELHRLREELRARDDVIKRLRTSLGERFDAELENRLLTDQRKKLEEGMRQVVGEVKRRQNEDEMPAYGKRIKIDEATSGESSTSIAANQILVKKAKNHVVKMPLEYLADILSYLDRFSLDRAGFTCPKLRTAVATLDGQNLRNVSSLRLKVTGDDWETSFPTGGGWRCGTGYVDSRRRLLAQAESRFTIVVECSSDQMALKNGATHANLKKQCDFVDAPNATSHFVGLLRNASVQQMMVAHPFCHQFLQALSEADVDVAVGSLAVESFLQAAANLAVDRESLMSFNRLEKLAIDDAPLDLLGEDFLLAATQKRVTSITLTSDRFYVNAVGGGWNVHTPGRGQFRAAPGSEWECQELRDGLLPFLFRDDLDESAKVKLRFPAARVPEDICLKLIESAVSSETRYSIDVAFVAVNDVNEQLVGFEEYRRPDGGDHIVRYRVPDPNATDIVVELKIATMEMLQEDGAQPTLWKLIELRRSWKSGAVPSWGL